MKDWCKAVVPLPATIREAAEALSRASTQIALITSQDETLVGVVTDGDIRRGMLAGETLGSRIETIMETSFYATREDENPAVVLQLMREKEFRQVPILDANGRLVGLKTLMDMTIPPRRDNWVVLMAGGLGQRLRPLTEDCPKPLLSVGGRPVLETIMTQFIEHGFNKFYFSVNYRADMIEDHFGDGSKFGAIIRYLHEDKRLGTAGALGLLPKLPEEPLFVMNGDVLTRVDFPGMLDFHKERKAQATMAVRSFEMKIPYGVVEVDDHTIVKLAEKPVHQYFVNAGIYVLSPQAVATIPPNEYLDMPTLFDQIREDGNPTAAFPIHEYWMDIGQKQDFEQANFDYCTHFE
ncbi:nucleotidyltransferase family protein [Pseudodesulfovibrio sp.]|nr:nucleotidyltransferase family protein [Pseudodesulfovibrio sp.]